MPRVHVVTAGEGDAGHGPGLLCFSPGLILMGTSENWGHKHAPGRPLLQGGAQRGNDLPLWLGGSGSVPPAPAVPWGNSQGEFSALCCYNRTTPFKPTGWCDMGTSDCITSPTSWLFLKKSVFRGRVIRERSWGFILDASLPCPGPGSPGRSHYGLTSAGLRIP